MKTFLIFLSFFSLAQAADLSSTFQQIYKKDSKLCSEDIRALKEYNFVLVPGIMSEMFIRYDHRTVINVWFLTGDYFGGPLKALKKVGLSAKRLAASSASVVETRDLIKNSVIAGKKTIFMTHSLGGLALLEELILNPSMQDSVGGIIFLQSPFFGAPLADVYLDNPYNIQRWVKPLMPFFNTSEEVIRYLSLKERYAFMETNKNAVLALTQKIPMVTVAGVSNRHASVFSATADIIEVGCVKGIRGKCISTKLFHGPFDESDGMVPLESSKLQGVDFIRLEGMDHGEPVLNVPFDNFKSNKFVYSLLKMLKPKL